MIIVGSSVVVGKLIVQSFPVFLASELRFLVAAVILVPLLLKLEGFPSVSMKDLCILILQAICGLFLFSIFMLYGLELTTAIDAGIITSILPAVIGALALLFLKEKLTKRVGIGIFLAVVGVMVINGSGDFSIITHDSYSMVGNLLILGAVICEALFIILGKFVSQRVSPLALSTFVSVLGAILFLPFSLYEGYHFKFDEVTFGEWGLILYSGIVVTVIAFIMMYQGVSKVPASKVGVLTGVLPISSIILSVVILGEVLSFYHIIGTILVLVAIFIMAKRPERRAGY